VPTKPRILIVEDEAIIAEDLRLTLLSLGYEVPEAINNADGLIDELEISHPDLVLMDITLSGETDGIKAAEEINRRLQVPVIYLTAHTSDEVFSRAILTEPYAYLSKPFDRERIRFAIEIALHKHKLQQQTKDTENRYRLMFEASGAAMMIVDPDGVITMINEAFSRMCGYCREEVENVRRWDDFFKDGKMIDPGLDVPGKADEQCRQWGSIAKLTGQDGSAKDVCINAKSIPDSGRLIVSMLDITNLRMAEEMIIKLNGALKQANSDLRREVADRRNIEKLLLHQASHDPLTGLPNRNLLYDRMKQAFAFDKRHNKLLAVMVLDLDNFKKINDTLGHSSGDILLKDIARQLQKCMRQYDTVARIGGDEFVIIVNEMRDLRDIVTFASKVRDLFRSPFKILDHSVIVTASIGIAVYPMHGTTSEALMQMADTAMYDAKKQGKNTFCFYSQGVETLSGDRSLMRERLMSASRKNEFLVHYQPRVDCASGNITGMEALLRWQPEGAPLAFPSEFLSLLEESGLVLPVGQWLFTTVCRQNKAWQDAGLQPLRVAVNVSERQFLQEDFAEKVIEALKATGLEPRYLEIELTEQVLMENIAESILKLEKLKAVGVTISVDDFGTGYSSLSHLNRLPIDELKIDRRFVSGMLSDPKDAGVVTAALAMGHSLGKKMVAEGVESAGQYEYLAHRNCEGMQGYYFSRPLPTGEFEQLLSRKEPLKPVFH
jgi:diguanylate cyclase (GGDEF)-like protein/PAS domain S-box-containing protein